MRRSDGFTLIEVLVAASVGMIVFLAALALLGISFDSSYGVVQRTEAMQRGRLALDRITRELRSQVCPTAVTPSAITAGATDKSVTLYVDLTDGSDPTSAVKHTLTFAPDADSRHRDRYRVVDTVGGRQRVLLDQVYPVKDDGGDDVSFLRYWGYPSDDPEEPTNPLGLRPSGLTSVEAQQVARIDVAFQVQPEDTTPTDRGITLSDQVTVRGSNPDDDPTYAPCT